MMTSGPLDEGFDVQSMLMGYKNSVEERTGLSIAAKKNH